ncbi:MAG: hypothetical protein AABY18_03035 [Candidatus Thermoplasmatota archaeon]
MAPSATADCHTTTLGCEDCEMTPSGDGRSEDDCTIGRVKDVLVGGDAVKAPRETAGASSSDEGRVLFEFTWDTADGHAPPNHAPVSLTIVLEDPVGIDWDASSSSVITMDDGTTATQREAFPFTVQDDDWPTASPTASLSSSASSSATSSPATGTNNSNSTSATASTSSSVSASGSVSIGPLAMGGERDIKIPFTIIADEGTAGEQRVSGVFTYHTEGDDRIGIDDWLERYWPALALGALILLAVALVLRALRPKTAGIALPPVS